MIKKPIVLVLLMIICTLFNTSAFCEEAVTDRIYSEEWSWEAETVNVFAGDLELSDFLGQELTICLKSEFQPESEKTQESTPLFVIVNGSRITMLNQSDTIIFTPDDERPALHFEGRIKMPEGVHVQQVKLTLLAKDPDEKELKSCDTVFSLHDHSGNSGSGVFYIPFEIRTIAMILAAAAVLVWGAALIRHRIAKKTNKRETGKHADL